MRVLLDTKIYLWFLDDSPRLSITARRVIAEAAQVLVSAASVWEASIKIALGKLDAQPKDLVAGIAASGFTELPISARHAARVSSLPDLHRDPFDRLLLAQAIEEPLNLLTADPVLRRYSNLVVQA